MPNINNIKKAVKKIKSIQGQEILIEFKDADFRQCFTLIAKIDELLPTDQRYAIMEQQGCHKTGKMDEESKKFGKEHSEKNLVENLN